MKHDSKEARLAPSPPFSGMLRGYLGFLSGTGKSRATIASYRGDLLLFERFLRQKQRDFFELLPKDLERYQKWLALQGLRINTRRRKLLTAKSLVKYAVSRKRLPALALPRMRAPERLERLPWIPSPPEMEKILKALEATGGGVADQRNWLVVHLLRETGLSLAELCKLRWEQLEGAKLRIESEKRPRELRLPAELTHALRSWRERHQGSHLFPGFNRHGITSEKMTPRGVELFFKRLARESGFRALKPKTLRHYCITDWLRQGLPDAEIQSRLGVHPSYPLDPYRKVVERDRMATRLR